MGMPELRLDNGQRDAFVDHLDRVRMPPLVRRKPPAHAGPGCEAARLAASGGG
jgi:hypothetical protein